MVGRKHNVRARVPRHPAGGIASVRRTITVDVLKEMNLSGGVTSPTASAAADCYTSALDQPQLNSNSTPVAKHGRQIRAILSHDAFDQGSKMAWRQTSLSVHELRSITMAV